ncbi:amidohydrolase family protein [Fodinicurvata sp. EGI_FJ10296]|uniref:amidohydrolase family protein n=1 Tax=Fodinicurvata sp. EGI_FJ10296 TaxID=3231908 RepID=UPI003455A329
MALIDFNSRPPIPAFDPNASHLANYRRVYEQSEQAVKNQVETDALQEYLDIYDKLDADYVVVKAKDVETTFGIKASNEDISEFCRNQGARFIGYAGVDPHKGSAAVRELEYAVKELGLQGLNLQCFEHRLPANDKKIFPLYAKCVELGVPVNIHVGTNFSTDCLMEHGRPMFLDEVMVTFPELKVIASPPGWPWCHELVAVAWRHRNVFIGISAVRPKYLAVQNSGYEALLQYGNSILQDQMVFGTSFPMQPIERAVAELKALPLKEAVQRKWMYENAARLLGVD